MSYNFHVLSIKYSLQRRSTGQECEFFIELYLD